MTDRLDPSPLIGCRVKWDAHTSASGTVIPAGEGTYEGACLCRLDDGAPVQVPPSRLTVLDMAQYRANLDRGREPDEWQTVESNLRWGTPDEDHEGQPYAGTTPIGPWRAVSHRADQDGVWVLWERPLRRVSR